MSTTEAPWPEADTMQLAGAILMGESDEIADWVRDHIVSEATEYTLIWALAAWCAALVPQFMPCGDDGMYALADVGATPIGLGLGQMLTAAMNSDHDALTGHVEALFEQPLDVRMDVMTQLMGTFRDFGKFARDAKGVTP